MCGNEVEHDDAACGGAHGQEYGGVTEVQRGQRRGRRGAAPRHGGQWLLMMEHKATLGLSLGICYRVLLHHLNVAFQSVVDDEEETMVTYSTHYS